MNMKTVKACIIFVPATIVVILLLIVSLLGDFFEFVGDHLGEWASKMAKWADR